MNDLRLEDQFWQRKAITVSNFLSRPIMSYFHSPESHLCLGRAKENREQCASIRTSSPARAKLSIVRRRPRFAHRMLADFITIRTDRLWRTRRGRKKFREPEFRQRDRGVLSIGDRLVPTWTKSLRSASASVRG